MFILVNPEAGGGRALERWKRIEGQVEKRIGPFECRVAAGQLVMERCVVRALERGETEFVAAGGDGTVNVVMSALVEHATPQARSAIRLGAIGLGSSNDFHKPLDASRRIAGFPCRLDFLDAVASDVVQVEYASHFNRIMKREWIINASVGTTAEANLFYNRPNRILRALKRAVPGAGMTYAALRTILRYRPQRLRVSLDGTAPVSVRARNLGLVKNPNFSGSLRYDSPHERAGGRMHVHLIGDVGLARLALVLCGLMRGRFGGPGTRSWLAGRVDVSSERPFAVEGDGEVIRTTAATFSILPEAILLCA